MSGLVGNPDLFVFPCEGSYKDSLVIHIHLKRVCPYMDNAQQYQVHCTQILQYRITVLKFDMAIEGEKGDNTLNMVKVDIQVELKTISIYGSTYGTAMLQSLYMICLLKKLNQRSTYKSHGVARHMDLRIS